MTNLAGPPRIKKRYNLEHCEAVVVLLMRSFSSRLLFLQNELCFASFVGEYYPSQNLHSLLVCCFCFCLFLLSFRLMIKIMMAKNQELQMVPIPKEERSIMKRRKMRKKRGPLSLRNHIGEQKCSWTQFLGYAQPSIFFQAALKQVPPTEF